MVTDEETIQMIEDVKVLRRFIDATLDEGDLSAEWCANAAKSLEKLEHMLNIKPFLFPCPFCGGEAHRELTVCDDVVKCYKCGARVRAERSRAGYKPEKDSVLLWNTRSN